MRFFWTFRGRTGHEANSPQRRLGGMGMSAPVTEIEREALGWLVRVNDPAFDQWDAWERWLGADPRHATSYWTLAETEADAVEALRGAPTGRLGSRRAPAPPRRAAIAAAVAALAIGSGWFVWSARPQPWSIETAAGERRTVVLADGSRVSLDGSTRVKLDRREPRDVAVEAGRALFEVVHDDRRPFRVEVADARLIDLGTTFDVTRLREGARVQVSEGRVRVDQKGSSATLDTGDAVIASPRGLERRSVSPEEVAGWRDGRLSWANEALPIVAQDLERVLGRPMHVAPSLAGRRFSGSLALRASDPDLMARLSQLLGVTIVEDGEGWRLEP